MYYECPCCGCKGDPDVFYKWHYGKIQCYRIGCSYIDVASEFEKPGELDETNCDHEFTWWDGDEEICIKCGKMRNAFGLV